MAASAVAAPKTRLPATFFTGNRKAINKTGLAMTIAELKKVL
jgi:hypothetical protein